MGDSTRTTAVQFSLSLPSSAASSRTSSPAPGPRYEQARRTCARDAQLDICVDEKLGPASPGRLPVNVYAAMLPRWRARIRQKLVKMVEVESRVIAKMQEKIRTPWLDAYFVYTSSLGTHTFFMTAIPALYFFGYDELGEGLILILAFGVYCTSVIKDLVCSPRPFAPPVTRLTIGSHHLEYGFPSTHSTNSISIALFLFSLIHRLTFPTQTTDLLPPEPSLSPQTFTLLTILLGIYAFSIVFGRLYTAMHCFTDCVMGVTLGTLIWWVESSWTGISYRLLAPSASSTFHPTNLLIRLLSFLGIGSPIPNFNPGGRLLQLGHGLGLGSALHKWVSRGGWEVPLTLVPLCLLAVNQHPQPVDDCPCFEDAIAFGSVVLGALVGKWAMIQFGASMSVWSGRSVMMPGSGWSYNAHTSEWVQVPRGWDDVVVWWSVAFLKMTFGIFAIFAWRLIAKSALHLILPPTYRLLSRAFKLPSRRFYTPATDYKSVPSEFSKEGGVLRPIPSVIDLPAGRVGVEVEAEAEVGRCNGVRGRGRGRGGGGRGNEWESDVKMRCVGGDREKAAPLLNDERQNGMMVIGAQPDEEEDGRKEDKDGQPIRHYDADVMTRLVVYAGIAVLASEVLPALYDALGWGVRSWPS
ncbi:hypothetical protein AX17_004738 [Amanita inopinata Kibby_2008]|nr:hypothetical protein AX17_004738 [Amanita inopinata Kibby_2008]